MSDWRDPRSWASLAVGGAVAGAIAVQQRYKNRIATDPEREALSASLEGRELTIRSADGIALHVKEFGPKDATPIVLAHGWTENLSFWTYQIQALSKLGFRVIAYDHRGHGESEAPEDEDYSIERFGEDLEAVLEHCVGGPERAVIAGHSLGAMAIAAWATDHEVERRVGAAAMINTGVGD